jgi:hypothetical protein
VRILRRRITKKIENVLGRSFLFRRIKGARDAVGMLRIVSKQAWDVDEELCVLHRLVEGI